MNSTNIPLLTGTFNTQSSEKRKFSNDGDERQRDNKKAKRSWFITLERESSTSTDDDKESVHSTQGYETELAQDTSDTSTHSCISSGKRDISIHVEYELDSRSENENIFETKSSSSEPQNILPVEVITFCESEGLADDSDVSISSTDTEIRKANFRICVQCNNPNNNPLFRYCEKCYQVKKMHFPRDRPRRKSRLRQKEQSKLAFVKKDSVTSAQELCQMDSGIASNHYELSSDPDKLHSSIQMNKLLYHDDSIVSEALNLTKNKVNDSQEKPGNNDTDSLVPTMNLLLSKNMQSHKEENVNITTSIQKTEIGNKQHQTQVSNGLCNICIESPKNGAFVHGKTLHVCCCYRCAKKVLTTNGYHCPICKRKVTQILKIFYV